MAKRQGVKVGQAFRPPIAAAREMYRTLSPAIVGMYYDVASFFDGLGNDLDWTAFNNIFLAWDQEFTRLGQTAGPQLVGTVNRANIRYFDRLLSANQSTLAVQPQLSEQVQSVVEQASNLSLERFKSIPASFRERITSAIQRNVAELGSTNYKDIYDAVKSSLDIENPKKAKQWAAFVARNQNSYVTGEINRARSQEFGITSGVWVHSRGARYPRISHVEASDQRLVFNLATGAYLWEGSYKNGVPKSGKFIWVKPGELYNCGCTYLPVVDGVDPDAFYQ